MACALPYWATSTVKRPPCWNCDQTSTSCLSFPLQVRWQRIDRRWYRVLLLDCCAWWEVSVFSLAFWFWPSNLSFQEKSYSILCPQKWLSKCSEPWLHSLLLYACFWFHVSVLRPALKIWHLTGTLQTVVVSPRSLGKCHHRGQGTHTAISWGILFWPKASVDWVWFLASSKPW